jgi:hypothetical protein
VTERLTNQEFEIALNQASSIGSKTVLVGREHLRADRAAILADLRRLEDEAESRIGHRWCFDQMNTLREALERYGRHTSWCQLANDSCNCGYVAIGQAETRSP